MAYARLLSLEVRTKLTAEFSWKEPPRATATTTTIVFTKSCPTVEDWPIKSTNARAYSKMEALLEAQNHRCGYCGIRVLTDMWNIRLGDRATIDHVIPQAAKGSRCWSNEIIACQLCNQGRGAMRAERYFEKVVQVGRMLAALWGRRQQSAAMLRRERVLY